MEPGWSQREEGREVRENEVVDRSAGSGGLKVRERQPDWGGDHNPGILLFCRPRSQGQKKEGEAKVEASAAVGGPGG